MAKTAAILVVIFSVLTMQSVSGTPNVNYNQDHVETAETYKNTKFYIKGDAIGLEDRDGWTASNSDPYMEVIATDVNGYTETKRTPNVDGPDAFWNDYLEFSQRTWEEIKINIMDYDGANREPDRLCPVERINAKFFAWGSYSRYFNCWPGSAHIEIRTSLPR